ncbi:TrbI/VirB10 family protein [Caminibacter sp.]
MGFFDKHLEKLDDDLDFEEFDTEENESDDKFEEHNSESKEKNKKGLFKNLFKKKKKPEYLTQDDIAQNKKKIVNKLVVLISVFGFFIILLMALYIYLTKVQAHRAYIKSHSPKKEINIKLTENTDNLWKLQVDNQIKYLKKKVDDKFEEIKKVVKEENNQTIQAVNNLLEEKVTSKIENLQNQIDEIKEQNNNINSIIKEKTEEVLQAAKTYTLQKSLELESKLSKLKPVSVSIKPNVKNTDKKSNGKDLKEQKKADIKKEYKKRVIEVEKEVSNLSIQNIPIDNEVQSQLKKEKKAKEEKLSYHLMTGFTKATLITGVSAPTFSAGVINPKPVLLSVNGNAIIANDQQENISDCMLIGKATGNMNTSRAEILITRISCSIPTSQPGVYKKIEAIGNPVGWVIGEDGKYGLRGRLVDSAGKLITRQIMVGFLQGVSQAFAPSNALPVTLQSPDENSVTKKTASAFSQGTASGVSNAFSSLAEYYKKMLDGMYPYVDVMAGRKVTVLLKGFQDIKITKYKKVDISERDGENGNEEVDYEVQIDYNDF